MIEDTDVEMAPMLRRLLQPYEMEIRMRLKASLVVLIALAGMASCSSAPDSQAAGP